jgi:serine/threonine protein kinase, bacterial
MMSSGMMIANRYHVLGQIGRGGMQDVYRAHDALLNIDVALKTPQQGQVEKRFANSARFAARVNHHNVAKTLDYIEENGRAFLIEELIEGETLDVKLKAFRFIDPHLGAQLLHHLAKGVAASHHAGVVHRDLKPSNVMAALGPNIRNLKVTDFGIATLTTEVFDEEARNGDLTRSTSGTVRGALPYMAPEMMFRKPGDHPGSAADIWSIGAMMFHLLTGDYPFGVYLEAAVNVKTGNRKPWPQFMTLNPQFVPLATEMQRIVDLCLQENPASRPTADDLVLQTGQFCYIAAERKIATVDRLIQNGYSAFATSGSGETVFVPMDSLYGALRQEVQPGRRICYCSFEGTPRDRAHPVLLIN